MIVTGAPGRDRAAIARALGEAARVHALLDHPMIPRASAVEVYQGEPFLELECDAVVDGHGLLRWIAASGERLPYATSDTIFAQIRVAMQGAHRTIDPKTNAPICLGTLSLGNLLFSALGHAWVVGFGHNFVACLESGGLDGTCAVFQAAEVSFGMPPSPGSDYVAVLLAVRSLVGFADVAELSQRVLSKGALRAANLELFQLLRYFETEWIGQRPDARPSIEEAVQASARMRELLGTEIDVAGLQQVVTRLVAEHLPMLAEDEDDPDRPRSLVVARNGSAVEIGGCRTPLGPAHARLLLALVELHEREPGCVLDTWTLLERGWPGEHPTLDAGANRVYVALTRLRQLGLRDVIERAEGGYRIRPGTRLRHA